MAWCKTSVRGDGGGGIILQLNQKKEGKKRVKKEIREKRDNKMGVETENMFIDKKSKRIPTKKCNEKNNTLFIFPWVFFVAMTRLKSEEKIDEKKMRQKYNVEV